jgi:hypothetical protein
MNRTAGPVVYFFLAAIIAAGLLAGCAGQETVPLPPQQESPPVTEPPAIEPPATEPAVNETGADKVEIVYFHRPQRCTKCLCFEERVKYVVENYFHEETESGKISFKIINLADEQEAATIQKYNAIASQLFINTIIDGSDNIRDVQEIWAWGCTSDPEGFDEAVRFLINKSLRGEVE